MLSPWGRTKKPPFSRSLDLSRTFFSICVTWLTFHHVDVIKWKHFPRKWPFVRGIHRSPVNSPHKGQWHGTLMFSLICAWINGWVNNGEAGDLRRYRADYDVIVMIIRTMYQNYSFVKKKLTWWLLMSWSLFGGHLQLLWGLAPVCTQPMRDDVTNVTSSVISCAYTFDASQKRPDLIKLGELLMDCPSVGIVTAWNQA